MVEMCSVIHILAVNPECQTIADAIIRHPVLILGIYPAGYALCFETGFLKYLLRLTKFGKSTISSSIRQIQLMLRRYPFQTHSYFETGSIRHTLPVSYISKTIGFAAHSRYATNPQSITACCRTLFA